VPLRRADATVQGQISMNRSLVRLAIVVACGVLLRLAFPDFDLWPLAWVAWVPVLWIVLDEQTRHAWAWGFLCGIVIQACGFYWIVPYLQRFAHLPLVATLPIFLLLVAYQAVGWSLFCHLLRRVHQTGVVPVTVAAPVLFVAIEFVMPNVFVWYFALSQAWVIPVIQFAELTGPLGVSFLLMLSNAALYETAHAWHAGRRLPYRAITFAIVLIAAAVTFGVVRIQQVSTARNLAPRITVGVVQANTAIRQGMQLADARDQLSTYQKLSARLERSGAELIVWPEGSYAYGFRRDQTRDRSPNDGRRVRNGFETPVIFGTLTGGPGAPYPYNSALVLDQIGAVAGRFDKNILMLFGEYVPFYEQLKFIKRWIPDVDNFGRGTEVAVLPVESKAGIVRVAPMICYEDIFPSFGRRVARLEPNLLVNLTNDAWFGKTSEPWEHLGLSVYRAVEMRLDLVRATTTGISAFVDSTGRVYAKTASVDPDATASAPAESLLDSVAIQHARTLYARLGDWVGWSCLVLSVIFLFRRRLRMVVSDAS
jgi:apolipoprotein N-acyltransferase